MSGSQEEHERQRQQARAEQWLRDFARRCGRTCINHDAVFRNGDAEEWWPITYNDVIQAGRDYIERGVYFLQQGSSAARDLFWRDGSLDRGMLEAFWLNWEIATGEVAPSHADYPFRVAVLDTGDCWNGAVKEYLC